MNYIFFIKNWNYDVGSEMKMILHNMLSLIMQIDDQKMEERYDWIKGIKSKVRDFEALLNIIKDDDVFQSIKQWCDVAKRITELNKHCDRLLNYFAKKRESKG
jgi:DNA-binding protein H-NS